MKIQLHITKTINSVILTWLMITVLLASTKTSQGQTVYYPVYWDNHTATSNVPYCPCDSVKCIPPAGAINVSWNLAGPHTYHGDTLVLPSGFNGNITCNYNLTSKMLRLRPTAIPTLPNFSTVDTVCGVGTMVLDASNNSQYGFTNYSWNNGATTQTITIAKGVYWVNISNVCGSVSDTITIVEYNPNHPNLGQDTVTCQGNFVLIDPGTGYSNYLWTPGNSTTSYLMPTISGTYIVQTTNAVGGCIDKDTVVVTFLQPPTEQVCYAGFDTITFKNNIYFPTNLTANIDSFHVYKEVSLGTWNYIGNAAAGSDFFTDLNCSPEAQSYSYKIAVVDTCGNEGTKSAAHTTITLLATYDQGTNTYGFTWSAYSGLTVTDYYLYGINASGVATLIGSVNGNQFMYNYVNPSPLFVRYFVAFQTPGCTSKTNVLVKSNWVQSVLTSVNELTNQILKVYPNPAQDIVRIEGSFGGTLRLLDITGRLVLEQVNKDGYINISTLAKGSYILELRGDKGIVKTKLFIE